MDDQLTINDLPVECVDQILKCITDRVDRILARFVCKFWCTLIDQDCSKECYRINLKQIKFDPHYQNAITERPDDQLVEFSKICSTFANSQRKKTSFNFDRVDFKGSEQFWRTKGKAIISLYFGCNCENIPLTEIVENCSLLKTLTLDYPRHGRQEKMYDLLESCVTDGKRNFSVRFLYLEGRTGQTQNTTKVVKLVSRVFLGLQNVNFFYDISNVNYSYIQLQWANEINFFFTTFKNLKFVITLSNRSVTFKFDPSNKVPVRITTLLIDFDYCNLGFKGISEYLSRYSCDPNHLNTLSIRLNDDYELVDVQKLITQYPSLKSLYLFQRYDEIKPLTNLLSKNNIENLRLNQQVFDNDEPDLFTINDAFLRAFENLKTFECPKLVFSDFVKLLRQLPYLKSLKVGDGSIDADSAVKETISSERLLELEMPILFLLKTNAKYDFRNLKKLVLLNIISKNRRLGRHFHKHLKRMNRPKLEILILDFVKGKRNNNQFQIAQLMVNILPLFPKLTKILFSSFASNKLNITENMLKRMLANHRRLKAFGHKSNPHILTMISPSVINIRWNCGQRVLNIP